MKQPSLSPLLDETDVATLLNVSLPTLRLWRTSGKGPRCLKLTAAVRYRPEDISAYLDSCVTLGGSVGIAVVSDQHKRRKTA